MLSLQLLSAAAMCGAVVLIGSACDRPDSTRPAWSAVLGLGAALTLAAGAVGLVTAPTPFTLPFYFGTVGAEFQLDGVAAWFLVALGLTAGPTCLFLPGYMDHLRSRADMRLFWGALSVLLGSMAMVVMASNVLTFLCVWELMSLSSFVLVATDHGRPTTRQAALIYLGATRIATGFLVGSFLWAHALTGSWTFSDWHLQAAPALGPALLLLTAVGIKAGMWPFHLWLPVAHPTAPAPVSALMSGLMVKVPIIVLIRMLVLQRAFDHPWLGFLLVGLGSISAFWGIAFALIQRDLKRLLAYSTVENVGLILLGVGGSLVAAYFNAPVVAGLVLAAALFHLLNHALFKTLLFLGAGAVDLAAGTRDLEQLGGLGQRMGTTFACFLVGSAAICALPPLNGFASEWLLYQSSLQLASTSVPPAARFLALLLIGWMALVGAMAMACFLKASAVAFLGRPRSGLAEKAHEVTASMQAAQGILAGFCVLFGLSAPAVLQTLSAVVGIPLASAWTLPMPTLAFMLVLTVGAGAAWLSAQPVRKYITWECGGGDLSPRAQVTGTSFVQPMARLFGVLFRYAIHLRVDGANRRLFPERIVVEPHTEAVLESKVYEPVVAFIDRIGDRVIQLQAGSIHLYLLTMFLTLMVLLAMGARGL